MRSVAAARTRSRREVAPVARAPAPAGTILGMAPFFPSDRDRLLLAFANLASYGIATRDAYGEHATEAHAAVAADLRLRHPHGLGAYVFWTATDDAASFDEYGRLIDELPLHIGGKRHRRGGAHRASPSRASSSPSTATTCARSARARSRPG